jgi:hypothetical protein
VAIPYIADHGDPYVFPAGVAQQEYVQQGRLELAVPVVGKHQLQAQACAQAGLEGEAAGSARRP